MAALTQEQAWQILQQVEDPEIPVVSVVEMGLIREIKVEGERVGVVMTPTFTGCPALKTMQDDIRARLQEAGAAEVEIKISHNPPWSSDWISPDAREKLRAFGLAPPPMHGGSFDLNLLDIAICPFCGSENTEIKNNFGPTLCRAIFYCNQCQQPFEQFKPI
jgi:ring-1,2-phenylacetyl-CoA epoxidase subunit PaaD